ncbi:conserved domain protein [delta proteobacterium NaphS2]|nr:conserved domain protein [delta proteobacterium NaphS2]
MVIYESRFPPGDPDLSSKKLSTPTIKSLPSINGFLRGLDISKFALILLGKKIL